ncbi:hypothetical protein C8J57DRAFT_1715445 [Mycena rebaudengoi]|nr:hypothetical protein C8J57DRAFT_1715445 [Mycena rebaudengoi]
MPSSLSNQQFQAVLGLNFTEFSLATASYHLRLQINIWNVARKYLDPHLRVSEQSTEAYVQFRQELSKNPLFQNPERLDYAEIYVKKRISRTAAPKPAHAQPMRKRSSRARGARTAHSVDPGVPIASASPPTSVQPYPVPVPTFVFPVSSLSSDALQVKEFLDSFSPSLAYLLPTFLNGGISDKKTLEAVSLWPRHHLVDMLVDLGSVGMNLTKVEVESIVLKLKPSGPDT